MSVFLSSKFPGEIRKGHDYAYFLPADIFLAKRIVLDGALTKKLEEASSSLGGFMVKTRDIPDIGIFVSSYINKESYHSTRIEGTQANIRDAFVDNKRRIPEEGRNDWRELHQYIDALKTGIKLLDEVSLTERLIRAIHKITLSQVRGHNRSPGEYRKSQNWIGGNSPANAHFVPPAAQFVGASMQNLEKFIHDSSLQMPELIKIALIHWQFETIHPFLDGNGRVGRILIPLYLTKQKILTQPALFMSAFFDKRRAEYYEALDAARKNEQGMKRWLSFFLEGVRVTSHQGMHKIDRILELKKETTESENLNIGKQMNNTRKLIDLLFKQPVVDAALVGDKLQLTQPTANSLLEKFLENSILEEVTGKKRNRLFVFQKYLDIILKDE